MPHRLLLMFAGATTAAFTALLALLLLVDLAGETYVRMQIIGGAALAVGLIWTRFSQQRAAPAISTPDDIAEGIPGLGWVAGADRGITGLGARFREQFGCDAYGEACSFECLLHSDDIEEANLRWQRAWKIGGSFHGAYRFRGADGEHLWFLISAQPQRDQNGRIAGWHGTLVDIHALKTSEETGGADVESMRSILDNIPAMISTATANGRQEYNNRASAEFHGKNFEKLNGMQFLDSIHPDDRAGFIAARLHCMENAVPMDRRSRVRWHDGTYRWIQTRSQPMLDRNGNVTRWYGITMDIDDQIRAEEALHDAQEQLARASHLTTLAELSASIAHEVNQPLAAVVTNSHACRAWLSADPPNLPRALVAAERIARDSMAAAEVVSRIRALFARKSTTRVATDLCEVVQEVRRLMTGQLASEGTSIEISPTSEPLMVLADRVQIQQVLANLFRNGVDAMNSNDGILKSLSVSLCREGDEFALVEVRDTGSGITDPAGIFEPFFTTKKEGMGMGLAICRSIIEAHDGVIWVSPNAPRGTVFSFRLPALGAVEAQSPGRVP